ncbi:MAG: S-formylglutathione hydrolase, partial [Paracoccaceae bacterium]|nr:S-formylglutathione hydrolase [Paracoccaceae bacterium]
METVAENRCFGGVQGVYTHSSTATGTDMTFGLFLPEEAQDGPVPILWYLSGLTCTHENAMVKAGAQAWAAEQGIALVFPDTSPRGEGVPNDDAYDLGQGAGFYVNATQSPWSANFKMWDYIAEELPALLGENFPVDLERQSITGHSMGGHGALTVALKNPERYCSVSAFSPICSPINCPWGQKALSNYIGDESQGHWNNQDTVELVKTADDQLKQSMPVL